MAAKESKLHELHEMLAQLFLDDIALCKEAGIPMAASDKGVIAKFLKDNNVTMSMDAEAMSAIHTEFEDELAQRRAANAERLLSRVDSGDDELHNIL
jgi:hypothetical protein